MNFEQLTGLADHERFKDPKERALEDLMVSHYTKIAEVLNDPDKPLTEAHWAMDWCETYGANKGKVYVVAGLMPALDSKGKEIVGMRATPVVFCIPEMSLKVGEVQYFDKSKSIGDTQEKRELAVQKVIKDRSVRKLYNMHGWGADPYVSALPMIEAAAELDGVAVLLGMMGSMGTTMKDKSPCDFAKQSGYGWDEIRAQGLGAMYHLEGAKAFNGKNYGKDEIARIVFGHSMQGKTTLRMMFDELDMLPNTYFVPMTPVLAGGSKSALSLAHATEYLRGTGRHVHLGHNTAGVLMQLELKTLARLLAPEQREEVLLNPWILPFVKLIMKSYLGKGESWGEDIIFYAHMLEYIGNPHAILQAMENLENSGPTVSPDTVVAAIRLLDKFMLVYAGEDRVLSPRQLEALAKAISTELGVFVEPRDKQLVISVYGREWVILMFKNDNHYLKEESWRNREKGVIAMVKERVGWDK